MGWFSDKNKGEDKTPEEMAETSNDAYCTECKTWYDAGNDAQVNRHAH